MCKRKKKVIVFVCLIPAIILLGIIWMVWGGISNPAGRGNIGDISTPGGFVRVTVESDSFGEYLRHVRLQKRGSHMKYFNGKTIDKQMTKVYTALNANGKKISPKVFSTESHYMGAFALNNIPKSAYSKTFTVTPYYTNEDGTVVEGETKSFTIANMIK